MHNWYLTLSHKPIHRQRKSRTRDPRFLTSRSRSCRPVLALASPAAAHLAAPPSPPARLRPQSRRTRPSPCHTGTTGRTMVRTGRTWGRTPVPGGSMSAGGPAASQSRPPTDQGARRWSETTICGATRAERSKTDALSHTQLQVQLQNPKGVRSESQAARKTISASTITSLCKGRA